MNKNKTQPRAQLNNFVPLFPKSEEQEKLCAEFHEFYWQAISWTKPGCYMITKVNKAPHHG